MKTPKERNNLDLLELVCELHSRALNYPSKEMHDTYMEARRELEGRLKNLLQVAVAPEVPLPEFLYEDRGGIFIGYQGDTEVTTEWRQWLKDNMRQ